jgi:mono/diheme cytochrome c family protein
MRIIFLFSKMFYQKIILFTILLTCASALFCYATEKPTPRINADHYRWEFGQIEESTELKHTFKITNRGTALLLLNGAFSSCGCTVPKLTVKQLKPGESTNLDVVVDTTMKQGRITKIVSINSNDPLTPTLKIYLSMTVQNPHSGLTDDHIVKIFTDDHCNSCHVAKGNGLFGKDLYEADCAMCHGKQGLGAIGPQLLGPYQNVDFKQGMKKIASYGSLSHRSMPGFLVDAGGPLGKDQIDSILKYLGEVSQERYYPGKLTPNK